MKYVYILESVETERFYVGVTSDLRARIAKRLFENDCVGGFGVIQAWDVDRSESWPNGRHCKENEALPV